MKFMTGAAAHKVFEDNKKAAEANAGTAWRFRLKMGEEAQITFLDGKLEDSLLTTHAFYEHTVQVAAKYVNYVCTEQEGPCPLCEQDSRKAYVALFTVIDHRVWKDKNGKERKNERKLFVCKGNTFEKLQHKAKQRGGLAGCTFDVARLGSDEKRAESVGTDFDFVDKATTIGQLVQKFGLKPEECQPFDYDVAIKYVPPAELRKLGFGLGTALGSDVSNLKVASAATQSSVSVAEPSTEDQSIYDQQL